MQPRFLLILLVVTIDAMGIGMVFPTMPALVRSLLPGGGDAAVTRQYGLLLAAYAGMNLLSSPVLGVLSDRFGRRLVLLAGLFGTAFDNLVMALAPTLPVLYAGRMLAGVTGATLTTANAYVADITPEKERSRAFGRVNACFGIGFIAGPIVGGFAGSWSVRAPFYIAAALNCVTALVCVWALSELRKLPSAADASSLRSLNPIAPLTRVGSLPGIGRLLYIFGTLSTVNQVTGVLWVVYGTARFLCTCRASSCCGELRSKLSADASATRFCRLRLRCPCASAHRGSRRSGESRGGGGLLSARRARPQSGHR